MRDYKGGKNNVKKGKEIKKGLIGKNKQRKRKKKKYKKKTKRKIRGKKR
jgi:hypothetical protein